MTLSKRTTSYMRFAEKFQRAKNELVLDHLYKAVKNYFQITCTCCGFTEFQPYNGHGMLNSVEQFIAHGWTYVKDVGVICPDCAQKRKEKS
jgi:hypothetical protein